MATPDDTQTVAPPDYPSPQEIQAALAARGVTAAAAPPPSAAPAAAADPTSDYIKQQLALLQAPLPQIKPDTTPAQGGIVGLLGKIGMALAGGSVTDALSPAQRERAGIRALGDFGTSLMAGSGYYPGKPMFGGLAQGFEGAARSEAGSEQQAASYLGAQQTWQMEQQKLQMERLKEALPLLQMQYGANLPNPLLSANTPAVPGTASGAGKPGGGGIALTPFIAKNLPAGVTPAEDQMVRTVIGEAGGEPLTGQQGVAAVIKNRMAAGKQDAQSVIFAPNQFEPWNNPATRAKLEGIDPGSQLYQDVLNKAVRPVMSGDAQDPTGGATNFYSPTAQKALGRDTPSWAAGQTPSTVIGGHQFYKLPFGPGTQVAGPGAPTGGPAAPAAPSTATDTPPPPAATPPPGGQQTFEQFQALHPIAINAADYTVTPPGLAEARAAQTAAAQQLSLARAGRGGDPNKSLSDYNTATQAVNKLQQDAQAKSLELQQAAQKNARDTQRQLYDAEQQRQAQAAIETQKIQAAAAEAERQRQAALNIEQVKAGITQRQKQADADVAAGSKLSETYDANAAHAGEIHTMLAQLGPNLQNLPQGFTAQLMAQHPGLVTTMANAGLVDPKTRDAVQLVTGLNNYLSVALRPLQSGSLRNVEMEKFQAALPNMLQSPAGQQKALAFLLNMTDRVQKEADYVRGQFHRPIPDPTNPNATLPAYNLPPDLFSKMDKELGPVLPHYSGGAPTDATAADYQKYVQSQKPGMPYYGYTRVVRNGQPVLDKNGRQVMREELQVAPEE